MIIRSNIRDYLTQNKEGMVFLYKNPLPFDKEGRCILTETSRVIDMIQFMQLLDYKLPVHTRDIEYVAEHILLMEEANPGKMFKPV